MQRYHSRKVAEMQRFILQKFLFLCVSASLREIRIKPLIETQLHVHLLI